MIPLIHDFQTKWFWYVTKISKHTVRHWDATQWFRNILPSSLAWPHPLFSLVEPGWTRRAVLSKQTSTIHVFMVREQNFFCHHTSTDEEEQITRDRISSNCSNFKSHRIYKDLITSQHVHRMLSVFFCSSLSILSFFIQFWGSLDSQCYPVAICMLKAIYIFLLLYRNYIEMNAYLYSNMKEHQDLTWILPGFQ